MSEYSSEPWKISDDGAPPCISDSDGNLVAEFVFTFNSNSYEIELANGRRIVACVNACADVSNHQLGLIEDAGGVADLLNRNIANAISDSKVEQQRDKLLTAVKDTIIKLDELPPSVGYDFELDDFAELLQAIVAEVEASK